MAREISYKVITFVALGALALGSLTGYVVYKYKDNKESSKPEDSREQKEIRKILENRKGRL